jgi:ABC-type multidrug transport system fused ATPase/permease subunit
MQIQSEGRPSTFETLGWVWQVMTRQPWALAAMCTMFLLVTLCDAAVPFLITRFLNSFEGGVDVQRAIYWACMTIGIGWVAFYVLYFIGSYINARHQTQAMASILKDLHAHVQRGFADWHANQQTGASVVKITRAAIAYELFTDSFYHIQGLLTTIIVMVVTLGILAIFYPFLALGIGVILGLGIVQLVLMTLYYVADAIREAIQEENRIGGHLTDRLSNNAAVKSFAAEGRESGHADL